MAEKGARTIGDLIRADVLAAMGEKKLKLVAVEQP